MADEELSVEKDAMFRKHRRDKHSHAESARSEFQKNPPCFCASVVGFAFPILTITQIAS